MITPEEMREIIAQLDFLASDHRYVAKWATERHGEGANDESGFVVLPHNPTIGTYKRRAECLERAAAMLRSIAAEREAEAKRKAVKQAREHYIFEYEQEHGKGSFDATGE